MVKTIPFFMYPRGESNPYLKFRKLLSIIDFQLVMFVSIPNRYSNAI